MSSVSEHVAKSTTSASSAAGAGDVSRTLAARDAADQDGDGLP